MNREDIIDKVKSIIWNHLGIREFNIKLTYRLKEDLGADSLDEIEMLMAVEDEYDIEITDEQGQLLTTPLKVVDFIEKYI